MFYPKIISGYNNFIVVSIEEVVPKTKFKDFIGKPVSECTKQLSGIDIDAVVKIAFKKESIKESKNRMR